jgi:hypothetical protein
MTRNLVGIGTTDPQYTLDVAGDINVTGGLFSNGQNVSGALYWTETAGENVVTNANVGIGITGEPSERLHVEGNILVKGNVVPAENETYDLGTSTSAFRDLYLSGDTIFLGNTKITSDPVTGSVTFLDKDSNEVKEIVSENTQNISVQDGNTIIESGNVGIGVTNPADKLVVGGNARIDGNLTVNGTQTVINTNVEETSRIEVTNNGTGPAIIVNQIGAQPIANFQDDGVSALFIADGGNVGIGITNPADKLHVQGLGNFVADSNRNMDLTAYIDSSSDGAGFITRFGRGTEASPQAVQSGDVIFGIYSRGRHESAFSTNNVGAIRIRASENFTSLANGTLIDFATTTNGSTSRTTRMTIGNDGNVGIGRTNPQAKLHVNGGSANGVNPLTLDSDGITDSDRALNFDVGGANYGKITIPVGSGGAMALWTGGANSATERMRITTAGNVGIGSTNPLTRLSITPSTAESKITLWDGGSSTDHLGFGVSSGQLNYHVVSTASHVFYTGGKNGDGTERMRITGSGNVGIDRSNPITKLEVNGNLKAGGITSAQSAILLSQDTGFGVIQGVRGDTNNVSNDIYLQPYGGKVILTNIYASSSIRYYTFNQVWHQANYNSTLSDMMLSTTTDSANSSTRRTAIPFNLEIDRCVITTDPDTGTANTYRLDFYRPERNTSASSGNIYPTIIASRTLTALPAVGETGQAFTFTPVSYNFNDGMSIRVSVVSGSPQNEFILSLYGYQV